MSTLRLVVPPSTTTHGEAAHHVVHALTPMFSRVELLHMPTVAFTAMLRELSFALCDLVSKKRERASVLTDGRAGVWEIGIELDGGELLVSMFQRGRAPNVAQTDRAVPVQVVHEALLESIARLSLNDAGLSMAREALLATPPQFPPKSTRCRVSIEVQSSARGRLLINADAQLRPHADASGGVARADLHALLFRGDMSFAIGESRCTLSGTHVFLVAEELTALAEELLDAHARGHALLRRVVLSEAVIAVRLDERGRVGLGVTTAVSTSPKGDRLPTVSTNDFVRSVLSFGRRLCKKLLTADASQRANLRLSALRRSLGQLAERVDGGGGHTPKLNVAPESYRAFAESDSRIPPAVAPRSPSPLGKLRFAEAWRADVPGVDLRSLYLAGDHVLVAASRELACIERDTGRLAWTRRSARAVSILTPVGLARLAADGALTLCDIATGEPLYETQLSPCVGASASGAVVNAPGLPRMLMVADGARHLAAVDLDSRELSWRRALRPRGTSPSRFPLRLRRAGKLMIATAGETTLTALDVLTGEIVWRHCGDHRYVHAVVDGAELYALSCELVRASGPATIERLDPWSGKVRWRATLPRRIRALGPPLCTPNAVIIISADEDNRTGVIAYDRETGEPIYDLTAGLCGGTAATIVVDDTLIANSDTGELVGIDCATGETRYRHVFGGDRPHGLTPVLRSGALFVPQNEVFVVRPSDGSILGRVPSDLVPDAVRVDERCGVYVAESSGYLAAYRALPTLSLVKAT